MRRNVKPAVRTERHLPAIGTRLMADFKGKRYEAVVVEAPEFPEKRGVKYNKIMYRSMTAAARAATGNSVNGWRFWKT